MGITHKLIALPTPHTPKTTPNDLFTIQNITGQVVKNGIQNMMESTSLTINGKTIAPFGWGAYSRIYKVLSKHGDFALKILNASATSPKTVQRELGIFNHLGDHANIVPFYGEFQYKAVPTGIWLGLCNSDARQHFLNRNTPGPNQITPSELGTFIIQSLSAVAHCHHKGIIHGDIKPENFLVKTTAPHQHTFLLTDFNLSIKMTKPYYHRLIQTRYYRAPEVVTSFKYNQTADTWSLGCVYIEFATGKVVFQGKTDADMGYQILNVLKKTNLPRTNVADNNIALHKLVTHTRLLRSYKKQKLDPPHTLYLKYDEKVLSTALFDTIITDMLAISPANRASVATLLNTVPPLLAL